MSDVAIRSDELVQYLVLYLMRDLGVDVRQVLGRQESTAAARHEAVKEALASSGHLHAQIHIPNTAGPLDIVADLTARQVTVSTELEAPKDGRSRGRIGWLVRQLAKAPPDTTIEARVTRTSATLAAALGTLREDVAPLIPESPREVRGFRVSVTRDLGMNRMARRGAFITSVVDAVVVYYREVLQNLTAWHPPPKKLKVPAIEAQAAVTGPPADAVEAARDAASPEDGIVTSGADA